MTELTFLIDLLLNHKLPKVTRDAVAERIKVVEAGLKVNPPMIYPPGVRSPDGPLPHQLAPIAHIATTGIAAPVSEFIASQPASTRAMLEKHPDLAHAMERAAAEKVKIVAAIPGEVPKPDPAPVAQIAQTAATMSAMQKRNETIALAMNGKVDKETGRPRKW